MPQITHATTGPTTSPAAIKAGQLAGLTLAQLITEGTPFILDPLKSAGYSNAKLFDAQAAAEAVLTLFVTIQSGSKLIYKIGCLDRGQTGSLSLIACCDELVAWIMHSLGKSSSEGWMPALLDWDDYEAWVTAGSLSLEQRIYQRVESLLASHQPAEIATSARYRFKGVIQRANASIRWTKGS
jgi:trimethylamine:corrinoid methyltransferase-like protein